MKEQKTNLLKVVIMKKNVLTKPLSPRAWQRKSKRIL